MKSSKLEIGEVARRSGLRPSAVRYYEERGLIEPEGRSGGRRVYSEEAGERLALITFAKNAGFTLDDIRTVLTRFPAETTAGVRWSQPATVKLAELHPMAERIRPMRA